MSLVNALIQMSIGSFPETLLLESLLPVFLLLAKPDSTILISTSILANLILSDLIDAFKLIKATQVCFIYFTFGMVTYFHMVGLSVVRYDK